MKLLDDQIGIKTRYIIINGNGRYPDYSILHRICEKYNGQEKIIIFPRTPFKNYRGLSALQNIKSYLGRGFRNFIFIVDREHISQDAYDDIKNNLIGIEILDKDPIQDTFLLRCKKGNTEFNLFCSISGLTNCIEEGLKELIESQINISINVPPIESNANWRNSLKNALDTQVGRRRIKSIIKQSGLRKLESAFPNLCAIFKNIEENYEE